MDARAKFLEIVNGLGERKRPGDEEEWNESPMLEELIEVRVSGIHGLGVFARCDIPADTLIGCYEGERVLEDGTYVLWIDCEEEGVYGIDGRNALRYVNHASRPNATFEGEELKSLRKIRAGEEITFHYGADWQDHDDLPELQALESC